MRTHEFHKFWLKMTAIGIGVFAPIMFLATMPAFNAPARWILDFLAWPLDAFPSFEAPEMWFLSALSGGFLLGWALVYWCLSVWVYDLAAEPVRKTVLVSLCAWYLLDSAGSITSGNWPNAIWNTLFLMFLVGPLWRPAHNDQTI